MKEKARRYRAEHPDYSRQYYVKHREKLKEYDREYGKQYRAKHHEEARERGARWRDKHPDYHHQYRIDNANKYRVHTANRKALSMAAEGTFTDEQFAELCEQYDNRCLCCGKVKKLTVDHIVPLSKGGSNDISNVQPVCGPCNSKKHTETIDYRDTKEEITT